jgi:sulfite dehydrogenase
VKTLAQIFCGYVFLLGAIPVHAAEEAVQLQLGKTLFTKTAVPACGLCHTLKDANAEGAVGPVLDEIKPDTARIIKALQNGIGQMPSYKASLSDAQMQAIADYVAKAASN